MTEFWQHLDEPGWSCGDTVADPLTRADIARYAGAAGDVNLVHIDEPFALAAGHPGVLAHGMLTMGLTGSFVSSLVGHHSLRSFGGRFLAPVVAGDTLHCTASVRSVRRESDSVTVELDVCAATGDGVEVFRGTAVALQQTRSEEEA